MSAAEMYKKSGSGFLLFVDRCQVLQLRQETINSREDNYMPRNLTKTTKHVLVCNGKPCCEAGGEKLTEAVEDEIMEKGLETEIHVTKTFCNGRCQDKCTAVAYPEGVWYKDLSPDDAPALVDAFSYNDQLWEKVSHYYDDTVFAEASFEDEHTD